jgi:predicted PurR-regulated permease PerM
LSPLFRAFFFGVFVFLLWQLWIVFSPFAPAFLWAATFTLVFYPVHVRLRRRLNRDAAALLSSAAVFAGVVVPLGLLGYELARESASLVPAARAWLDAARTAEPQELVQPALAVLWDGIDSLLAPFGLTARNMLLHSLGLLGSGLGRAAAEAARELPLLALGLAVLGISLFFTFRNGEEWLARATELVPMAPAHKRALSKTLFQAFIAVVRGVLASAVLQGVLLGFGFRAAGLRFPVFLGTAAGLASLIPFVGATLVWGPACLLLLLHGRASGWILFAWCALTVVALDRLVKPRLVGEPTRTTLPELILFFSIVGGLDVFGANGVLLGPLLIATALAFVRIYRQEFQPPRGV